MKTCFCKRSPVALLVVCSVFVAPVSMPLLAAEGAAPGNTRPTLAGLEPSQIPEEFRGMAAPQTTVAEFYYGGRFVTSAMVTYTPDTITLTDPRALLERIGTISHLDKVEAALSGRIFPTPGRFAGGLMIPGVADSTRKLPGLFLMPVVFAGIFLSPSLICRCRPSIRVSICPIPAALWGLFRGCQPSPVVSLHLMMIKAATRCLAIHCLAGRRITW
ncbi:hypothetical protein [Endozoicomonas sp. GU-1]|uniref:hypothetical protein n=1 Tax=Endozoicomonas sp. GU-1 TaxID=3009078 RepID=UPI0022B31162|nr:hypothetical protein [Endozoicomonas sp. GU-1]WBA83443.1 hypothetical protein O2T12_10100 [Endozoicomonas sp. GU-1]WBA86374.1 hypothetical protein O3276_24765 [Endozoicomonas sp. GU-1]